MGTFPDSMLPALRPQTLVQTKNVLSGDALSFLVSRGCSREVYQCCYDLIFPASYFILERYRKRGFLFPVRCHYSTTVYWYLPRRDHEQPRLANTILRFIVRIRRSLVVLQPLPMGPLVLPSSCNAPRRTA